MAFWEGGSSSIQIAPPLKQTQPYIPQPAFFGLPLGFLFRFPGPAEEGGNRNPRIPLSRELPGSRRARETSRNGSLGETAFLPPKGGLRLPFPRQAGRLSPGPAPPGRRRSSAPRRALSSARSSGSRWGARSGPAPPPPAPRSTARSTGPPSPATEREATPPSLPSLEPRPAAPPLRPTRPRAQPSNRPLRPHRDRGLDRGGAPGPL